MKKWLWISVFVTFLGLMQYVIVPQYVEPDLALTQMNSESRHYVISSETYKSIDRILFYSVVINLLSYLGVWSYRVFKENKNEE